jgi:type VI secretion system protein VasJ
MFTSIKNKNSWIWHASGKHPAVRDYFQVGSNDPILKAFADWTESGYRQLVSKKEFGSELLSWRFWTSGGRKRSLICGVGRNSSDSLGRPYPLIIIGTGPLTDWPANWDLLPYALEGIWSQIEYLASGAHKNFGKLKERLRQMKLPSSDWLALANQRAMAGTLNISTHVAKEPRALAKYVQSLTKTGETFVSLYCEPEIDSFLLAGYLNCALKSHLSIVPKAVFMGGDSEKSYMAIFNRALNSDDFVRLWTISK